MMFKVTHIDAAGHCHRARVTARNVVDALDQVDREWGESKRLACVRMNPHPVLHVPEPKTAERRPACAS